MGGILYSSYEDALGVTHRDEPVATFENGKVYLAADGFLGSVAKGSLIGEYENGNVFSVGGLGKSRQNYIAVIENGRIYGIDSGIAGGYSKSLEKGECACGNVYSRKNGIIGKYSGDVEGAAAAAAVLLLGLTSNVSAYSASSGSNTYSSNSSSSGSSGAGCITPGPIFAFAFLFIIVSVIVFLSDNREYVSLIFMVIIPLILLVIKLLKVIFFAKGRTVKLSVGGAVRSAVIMFVYTLCTVGIMFSLMKTKQVLNIDLAITLGFILGIVNGMFTLK